MSGVYLDQSILSRSNNKQVSQKRNVGLGVRDWDFYKGQKAFGTAITFISQNVPGFRWSFRNIFTVSKVVHFTTVNFCLGLKKGSSGLNMFISFNFWGKKWVIHALEEYFYFLFLINISAVAHDYSLCAGQHTVNREIWILRVLALLVTTTSWCFLSLI